MDKHNFYLNTVSQYAKIPKLSFEEANKYLNKVLNSHYLNDNNYTFLDYDYIIYIFVYFYGLDPECDDKLNRLMSLIANNYEAKNKLIGSWQNN